MPGSGLPLPDGLALVVAAHPDDETIGMGGVLPRVAVVAMVHVTGGSPRNLMDARVAGFATGAEYERARAAELAAALELAGVGAEKRHRIGLTDQEVMLHMVALARRLCGLVAELRPAVIFTHPYEGGHPDHDATALAVRAACRLAPRPPAVWEFTGYHDRAGEMETGRFLDDENGAAEVKLSPEDCARKRRMIDCFATQRHMLVRFPVGVERFRPAPAYRFTRPPHPGTLWYERFDWGASGERFRAAARAALGGLGLEEPL